MKDALTKLAARDGGWSVIYRDLTIATDGRILIAVPGVFEVPSNSKRRPDVSSIVEPALSFEPAWITTLGDLRSWLGENPPGPFPCSLCSGSVKQKCDTCEGKKRYWHECECGDGHYADCEDCDDGFIVCDTCQGDGTADLPPADPAKIGSAYFNRTVARGLLPELPDETEIKLSEVKPNELLFMRCAGWFVAWMPYRANPDTQAPELPIRHEPTPTPEATR